MKKTIINLVFIFLALPAITFANGEWYTDDYSYDSGSWYTDDYSYGSDSWYTDDYSYGADSWYTDDYSYDSGSWYTDDYSYGSDSWYTDDYSYGSDSWYTDDYDYQDTCLDCFGDYYPEDDYYYGGDYAYNDDYYDYYDDYDYGCYDDCYDYDYDYCDRYDCDDDYNYDDLDVICTVSDRTIDKDDSVTFTADADGGRGSYIYRWSGDVSGSSRSITERFTREGTYYASVRVTDRDGRSATANCGTVRVEDEDDEDFDAVCKVSDTSIEEGDTVRFTAEVDGGDSPYDYDWSGDVHEDEKTFTKRFTREGRYEIDLEVRDDEGRIARDTCTIRVEDEDEDDRDINVSSGNLSSGNGTFAGVSSVYLNQVPYTGPEDVAKGIAFVVGILAWSIIGALIIRNRMNKKVVSNKIAAFKEANKAGQI